MIDNPNIPSASYGLPVLNIYPHLRACGIFVCPMCRQDCRGVLRTLWRRSTGVSYTAEGVPIIPESPDIVPTWFVFWQCHTCRFGHGHMLSPIEKTVIEGGEM